MNAPASAITANRDGLVGAGCAIGAFGIWGAFPLYFKAVATVPAAEVLAHRIVWSVLWVGLLLCATRQWPGVRRALQGRHTLLALVGSSLLIATNWLVFIWAVAHDRVLEASLGYYITPLVSVLLGRIALGERLWRMQWVAVLCAAVGVGWMLLDLGVLPWVSLVVATSFGGYGLMRKLIAVNAIPGLFLETLVIGPIALGYLVFLRAGGSGMFGRGVELDVLLAAAGLVTALPLILYAQGVRRLRLASVGLFQYITPTGQMMLAVFVFGEVFTDTHAITFGCIWLALALYSASAWQTRNQRPCVRQPTAGE